MLSFSSKTLRKDLLSGGHTNLRRQVYQVCHKMRHAWDPAWKGAVVTEASSALYPVGDVGTKEARELEPREV